MKRREKMTYMCKVHVHVCIRVYKHSGIKNLCFFSIHACSLSEEIELWKKQSQMKDIDLSRTREELSVTLTDIKRKEGTCNNESTIIVACVFKDFNLILITNFNDFSLIPG